MDLFQIDEDLATLLHDLSEEDLVAFSDLYVDPGDASGIQVYIFSCVQLYLRNESLEWIKRAYTQANAWEAAESDPDQKVRAARIKAVVLGRARSEHRHSLVDQSESLVAMDVFNGARYKQTRSLDDLDQTIGFLKHIMGVVPTGHPERPEHMVRLAEFLVERYNKSWRDGVENLNEAIDLIEQVLNAGAEESHFHAKAGNLLSNWLDLRYNRTGNRADLDQAVEVSRLAVRSLHADCDLLPVSWIGLGSRLFHRFEVTSSNLDLEESIRLMERSFKCISSDDPNKNVALNNLGPLLATKFQRSDDSSDLARAIHYSELAVEGFVADGSDKAAALANLGHLLRRRYQRMGHSNDLDRAIELTNLSMRGADNRDPQRPQMIFNMASLLVDRFKRNGDMDDLNRAARLAEMVVNSTPIDHSQGLTWINQAAGWLLLRFERFGALADLFQAMNAIQIALKHANQENFHIPSLVCNLACCHARLFYRNLQQSDLDRAIKLAYESLHSMTKDDSMRPRVLANLADWLRIRGSKNGDLDEIEEGIRYKESAVSFLKEDHPERSMYLEGLSGSFLDKYKISKDVHDLNHAIDLGRDALQSTSPHHADKSDRLNHLGSMLWRRFQLTADEADRQTYIRCFQECWEFEGTVPSLRIKVGRKLAIIMKDIAHHEQAANILEEAVALLPACSPRYLDEVDKQHALREFYGLASMAAAAALDAGRHPSRALKLLELGRGVAASLLLDMRTDLTHLSEEHPNLSKQFEYIRDELDFNARSQIAHQVEEQVQSKKWDEDGVMRRQSLHSKMNTLIQEIRQQPGYSNFLLSPSIDEMMAAACAGPIVVINTSHYRCDAILVQQFQVTSIQLPQVTLEEIESRAAALRDGGPFSSQSSRQLLPLLTWMWDVAACPILEELGIRKSPAGESWPRIWWIPTGGFTHLPIHAAGIHESDGCETVIDRVMSSYTLSVKALIYHRQSSNAGTIDDVPSHNKPSNNALVISMPETPNQSPLIFADEEAAVVKSFCDLMNLNTIHGGLSHCDNVLNHLQSCRIFHFAGHGLSDPRDPEESCLLLQDWQAKALTVSRLRGLRLQEAAPFLGYLSACSTGANKIRDLGDEHVHLISACQLAGFRHVVGSLWEVSDSHCVDVARIVYETLWQEGISDESVARGIHRATRTIRNRELGQPDKGKKRDEQDLIELSRVDLLTVGTDLGGDEERHVKLVSQINRRNDPVYCSLLWVPYVHYGV